MQEKQQRKEEWWSRQKQGRTDHCFSDTYFSLVTVKHCNAALGFTIAKYPCYEYTFLTIYSVKNAAEFRGNKVDGYLLSLHPLHLVCGDMTKDTDLFPLFLPPQSHFAPVVKNTSTYVQSKELLFIDSRTSLLYQEQKPAPRAADSLGTPRHLSWTGMLGAQAKYHR